MNETIKALASPIKLLICDVDGVLTDGRLHVLPDNTFYMSFHIHDGVGIKLLMKHHIEVSVITNSPSVTIKHRMQHLGIKHYYLEQKDKLVAYHDLQQKLNLADEQIAYVGDDLPDLPLIQRAGLGITVPNAVPTVKEHADWCTTQSGGNGAVREIADTLLQAKHISPTSL